MKRNAKYKLWLLFISGFIIFSVMMVLQRGEKNHDIGFISTELSVEKKVDNKSIVYTYMNALGENIFAIDKGYAIREQLKNINGQIIRENYYDADGNPVKLYDSYYGLSYEYKDHEQIIHCCRQNNKSCKNSKDL